MLFRSTMAKLRERASQFACSEAGMTLPLMALSLTALVSFTGIAIDVGRMQMLQSKLQFSLDAAGLAAGSTVSTASLNAETSKYLNTNFNGYMGAVLTGASVVADSTNTVFTLSATATLPSTFMAVLGVNDITVTATTQITRAVTGLELVLVLDNTGSMGSSAGGGVTKIQALKTAATSLVNTLFGATTTSTNGKLWVGMVPFSHSVNIGTSHTAWMGNVDATLNASWNGCVDARQKGYDVTDDPPSQSAPNTLFNLRSYDKCTTKYSGTTTCATVASCAPCSYPSYCGNSVTKITCAATGPYNYSSPLESGVTYVQPPSCAQQVTPMTNTSSTLLTAINGMTANGNTVVNQGLVWAWHMLSPRWRGLWGGTMNANGLPLDYDTKGMVKAVVILTDGENTISDSLQGSYWFTKNNWTGTTNSTTAVTRLDDKTLQVCQAMKAQGIYVYTIALGTDTTAGSLALLKNCATAINYYFNSPSTTQLQGVFNTIGDSLSNLRVSK